MKYFEWSHRPIRTDLEELTYRVEIDQRWLAVAAGLKVAALLLMLFW